MGGGIVGMMTGGPIKRPPGVLAPLQPQQTLVDLTPIDIGDFKLQPKARYDIEARWRTPGNLVGTSERKTWRELLKQVVENNSNYEVYVTDLH